MQIVLSPELERMIRDQVARGLYQTAQEVVRDALWLLWERSEVRAHRLEALRRDLQVGLSELEQGSFREVAEEDLVQLAESVKRRGRQRLET
jgi:antitoxin ParD1/3/4